MSWLWTEKFQRQGYEEHVEASAAKCLQAINHGLYLGLCRCGALWFISKHSHTRRQQDSQCEDGFGACVTVSQPIAVVQLAELFWGTSMLSSIVIVVLTENKICVFVTNSETRPEKQAQRFTPYTYSSASVKKQKNKSLWKIKLHFIFCFSAVETQAWQSSQTAGQNKYPVKTKVLPVSG